MVLALYLHLPPPFRKAERRNDSDTRTLNLCPLSTPRESKRWAGVFRVVGGVSGVKSYSYHLFGDTVNTASRTGAQRKASNELTQDGGAPGASLCMTKEMMRWSFHGWFTSA